MNFTPDAFKLGPLALEWSRFSLLLGLLVFLSLVGRLRQPKLDATAWQAALLGVLAARLGYALEHPQAFVQGGILPALLALVDIRSGGFAWGWGLLGAGLFAFWRLKREFTRLLPAGALAVGVALLPLLLKPAPSQAAQALPAELKLEHLAPDGSVNLVAWKDLPKPVLVNVWATWCPPCRAEMPLLAEYAKQGYPIVFLNSGEDAPTVRKYLDEVGISTAYLDAGDVQNRLEVSGLPTTLLIGADGSVKTRHLGSLNRVQVVELLSEVPRTTP